MGIQLGSVVVANDGTYTASGLAKILFEFRLIELAGSLVPPPVPPTTPAGEFAAYLGAARQAALDALSTAGRIIAQDIAGAASILPPKSATTPPGGGLAIALLQATATMTGLTTVTIDGTAHTITRSAGSWLTDGFLVGQDVLIAGSASNDTFAGLIVSVTATVLTFAGGLTSETIAPFGSIGSHVAIQAGMTRLGAFTKQDSGIQG